MARGEACTAQGTVREDDAVANQRLRAHISRLEAQLHESSRSDAQLPNFAPSASTTAQALHQLVSTVHTTGPQAEEAEHGEEEVETATAPLVSLLHNTLLGATPKSDQSGGNNVMREPMTGLEGVSSGTQSLKNTQVLRELCACLPSQDDLEDIIEKHASWWQLYQKNEGLVLGDVGRGSYRDFATQSLTAAHPSVLGLLLVTFAIGTGNYAKYLTPVERWIVHDDKLASTESGLGCLLGLGLCYLNSLRPRRAWTTYRRVGTLLQLSGLHLKRHKEKHDLLFWQIFHADKWVSLTVGLPYMLLGRFCSTTTGTIEELGPGIWLNRNLAVLSEQVIDVLQCVEGPSLSAALQVEEKLEEIKTHLPSSFLDVTDIRSCADPREKHQRLWRTVHFHQLRAYLHLPFLLRSAQEHRYEFSRKSCIQDCRLLLEAYLECFDTNPEVASNGGVLNFNAFTAAVVLLLGVLGYGLSRSAEWISPRWQLEEDWSTISRVMGALRHGAQSRVSGMLCQKCHTALESLVSSSHTSGAQRVVLPYFGTLLMNRQHAASSPEVDASHTPHDQGPGAAMSGGQASSIEPRDVVEVHDRMSEIAPLQPHSGHDMQFAYTGPFLLDDSANWLLADGMQSQPILDPNSGWHEDFSPDGGWNWISPGHATSNFAL